MFLKKVVPLVFLFVSGVWAQLEMAQCPANYEWNHNSLGQDACMIGSKLDASCRGLVDYNYPPINSSQYYLPPSSSHAGDLDCDCNTVMYNLYMACSSCQGGQTYPWTTWIGACKSVYVSQYPGTIPTGTAIPHWALFNVTSAVNQTYDEATMISLGQDPEETAPPVPTVTTGSTSRISSGTGTSTARPGPTSSSSNDTGGGTNVGAIVGGVVGSVVALTAIAIAAFWYTRRRRQQQAQPQVLNPDGLDPYKQRPPSMYGPPVTSAPFTPYNPSDPSTFPPQSPQSSVTYTTPAYNTRGTYSGAPEV